MADGYSHAFLYSNGVMTDIGTLGGPRSSGDAINASGQVTGSASLPGDTADHAFLYSIGVTTDLGTLGGADSTGTGINAAGQVVGYSSWAGAIFIFRMPFFIAGRHEGFRHARWW